MVPASRGAVVPLPPLASHRQAVEGSAPADLNGFLVRRIKEAERTQRLLGGSAAPASSAAPSNGRGAGPSLAIEAAESTARAVIAQRWAAASAGLAQLIRFEIQRTVIPHAIELLARRNEPMGRRTIIEEERDERTRTRLAPYLQGIQEGVAAAEEHRKAELRAAVPGTVPAPPPLPRDGTSFLRLAPGAAADVAVGRSAPPASTDATGYTHSRPQCRERIELIVHAPPAPPAAEAPLPPPSSHGRRQSTRTWAETYPELRRDALLVAQRPLVADEAGARKGIAVLDEGSARLAIEAAFAEELATVVSPRRERRLHGERCLGYQRSNREQFWRVTTTVIFDDVFADETCEREAILRGAIDAHWEDGWRRLTMGVVLPSLHAAAVLELDHNEAGARARLANEAMSATLHCEIIPSLERALRNDMDLERCRFCEIDLPRYRREVLEGAVALTATRTAAVRTLQKFVRGARYGTRGWRGTHKRIGAAIALMRLRKRNSAMHAR